MKVPFNKHYIVGNELDYINEVICSDNHSGDGKFTQNCSEWLQREIGVKQALMTNSGTSALDLSALLADIVPGDEIIMPSYTYVSTANAFVLRGGVPVFVDIHPDFPNLDESLIEGAITSRTKAIVVVHYAGVSCEMDTIIDIAHRYGLLIVEDAAQGLLSEYKGKELGSIGDISCLSFHETKNVACGQGGAVLVNNSSMADRAEVIRDKGTNRGQFIRNEVNKYSWIDIGSSFLLNEISAAYLWGQMQEAHDITRKRVEVWNCYNKSFKDLEEKGCVKRPEVPEYCRHNGHIYYLLLRDKSERSEFLRYMKDKAISAQFHYVPLHSSEAGVKFCKISGSMNNTNDFSERVVRMPMWIGVDWGYCVESVCDFFTD